MNKRTKALQIPIKVKEKVWERDGGCCVWCGTTHAAPEAHFLARSHGGLGIEENILTLCRGCHRMYDEGPREVRNEMTIYFIKYLKSKYPDWSADKLIYRKD